MRGVTNGLLALAVTLLSFGPTPKLTVVPRPSRAESQEGTFNLRAPVRIAVLGDSEDLRDVGRYLAEFLTRAGLPAAVAAAGQPAAITLTTAPGTDAPLSNPEAYTLTIEPRGIEIRASTADGAFWAVQTLRQLLPPDIETPAVRLSSLTFPAVRIVDAPKFGWRGSLLDVGRHFFSVAFVKRYIDLLALHKMNVLHWHLTEDQGWRIEIKKYPRLTSVGAWRTEEDGSRYGGFYTQEEVRDIVEYARRRRVTVVPEIEMPGHATAALVAYPEFSCTGESKRVPITWGVWEDVFCPGKEDTFRFLQDVLDEVMAMFPSKVIHIGGDEVPKTHWRACPLCQRRIASEHLQDEAALQSYFIKRIDAYVRGKGRQITGWDEILEGGLAPGATVQVWRDVAHTRTTVRLGNRVVASPGSHTYINNSPKTLPLATVFGFNPVPDGLTEQEAGRVLGGEAPIWTERITEANFDAMVFPRLAAFAEALWSGQPGSLPDFHDRLNSAHYRRLEALGVAYGPEDQSLFTLTPMFDPQSLRVGLRIEQHLPGLQFRYTVDGTAPGPSAAPYRDGQTFETAGTVRVQPFLRGRALPSMATLTIDRHLGVGKHVTLTAPASMKYPGTGALTLTDSLRGSLDFHDGTWNGWEGTDLEAVVDLDRRVRVRELEVGTLQDMRSWILLPRRVSMWVSDDGVSWRPVASLGHDVSPRQEEPVSYRFRQPLPEGTFARYVKVRAENAGPLPDWHPGAGGKAWIFADEIVVR